MVTYHVHRNSETIPVMSTGILQTATDFVAAKLPGKVWTTFSNGTQAIVSVAVFDDDKKVYTVWQVMARD